ncbi:hypothetical protein Ari01nite_81120 [Paractinoplanes rishiriensis]|uniref:Uncharacterized protein n=1 Tax=Paractinoplanes rishiriensis TaxID=1050105 RepID=A0A919K8E5_9ACTN|nr:hypothetical protein Ari01nite_81120 [Actinoplanes rishiriensis]
MVVSLADAVASTGWPVRCACMIARSTVIADEVGLGVGSGAAAATLGVRKVAAHTAPVVRHAARNPPVRTFASPFSRSGLTGREPYGRIGERRHPCRRRITGIVHFL